MIEIHNLEVIYANGTKAVDDVSLSIKEGEITILIGPSGCGKTTTLKTLNRLVPYSSGEIHIKGKDIQKMNIDQMRREIGYVIQQVGLFPHMTIEENISYVLKIQGEPVNIRKKRAEELIVKVGLKEDYLKRFPQQLSGGQQQRVGVARALAANPEIILMDEPFGALDPITRFQLQDEFKELEKMLKKTIVFVTHDMQEAYKLGKKVALLDLGKLVQVGTPTEIFKHPANDFVIQFIGADKILRFYDVVTVEHAMYKEIPKGYLGQPVNELMNKMRETGWDNLPVVDEKGVLKGIVSVNDIENVSEKLDENHLNDIKHVVSKEATLNIALEEMLKNYVGYLPVVDEMYKLEGLITYKSFKDILVN